MTLVEGLGDEVTVAFIFLTFILIAVIAWFSTHTADIPFINVIFLDSTHRAGRESSSDSTSVESDATDTIPDAQTSESVPENINAAAGGLGVDAKTNNYLPSESTANVSEDHNTDIQTNSDGAQSEQDDTGFINQLDTPNNETTELIDSVISDNVDELPLSANVLRQRRLAFLANPSAQRTAEDASCEDSNISVPSASGQNRGSSAADGDGSCPTNSSGNMDTPKSSTVQSESDGSSGGDNRSSGDSNVDEQSQADSDADRIRVRLKYLNDTQRLVYTWPTQTVQDFRRENFATELANNKLVRFIFNGQDLRNDGYTMQSYNIVDNSVVHCLVSQTQRVTFTATADTEVELGQFMLPLFGIMLGMIWYLRFMYKHYFNSMSTLCLVGVTFLFVLGIISYFQGRRPRAQLD